MMRWNGVLVLGLCGISPAVSADPAWQGSVVPYLWGAGVQGDAHLASLPVSVHRSFGETFDHLEAGGMAIIDLRRGRWGLLTDLTWIDTRESATVPVLGLEAVLQTRVATAALLGQYRFIDDPVFRMDALAGARYWSLRGDIAVDALSQRAALERDWVDPVLGVRLGLTLAERHGVTAWVMGSDSDDVTVDAMLSYGYRLTEHAWLRLGYRYMTLRQVGRGFDVDIAVSGPGMGLEARF